MTKEERKKKKEEADLEKALWKQDRATKREEKAREAQERKEEEKNAHPRKGDSPPFKSETQDSNIPIEERVSLKQAMLEAGWTDHITQKCTIRASKALTHSASINEIEPKPGRDWTWTRGTVDFSKALDVLRSARKAIEEIDKSK